MGAQVTFLHTYQHKRKLQNVNKIVFTLEEPWDPYSQTFTMLKKAYENKEHRATKGEFSQMQEPTLA